MKIIHCADIHLGSKLARFPAQKAEQLKAEVRSAFSRMIDYARSNNITNILLAGDVFDSDRPFKKDKDFFYSVVRKHPEITFYYLRGNHDGEESYTEQLENLKLFGEQWTSYSLGEDVNLSAIELDKGNCTSLYSSLSLDENAKNIVMLHGQTGDTSGIGKINPSKLKGKGIDYLALGHIHSYSCTKLDERGVCVYSGCLQGRGFDETGEKGFAVIDTENMRSTFVPFSSFVIEERDIDISNATDAYSAASIVKEGVTFTPQSIWRINLIGETEIDDGALADDVQQYLGGLCNYISVKDKTVRKIDYSAFDGSLSLKGEFIKCVKNAEDISDEDKQRIIKLGIDALSGRIES